MFKGWLKALKASVKVAAVVADIAVKNPQNAVLRDKAKDAIGSVLDSLEKKEEKEKAK